MTNDSSKIFRLYTESGDLDNTGFFKKVADERAATPEKADTSNSTEKREVQIGKQILKELRYLKGEVLKDHNTVPIKALAEELINMHSPKAVDNMPTIAMHDQQEKTNKKSTHTTKCDRCGEVLTNSKGERLMSANFSSSLPKKHKNTPTTTYAWCDDCFASVGGVK